MTSSAFALICDPFQASVCKKERDGERESEHGGCRRFQGSQNGFNIDLNEASNFSIRWQLWRTRNSLRQQSINGQKDACSVFFVHSLFWMRERWESAALKWLHSNFYVPPHSLLQKPYIQVLDLTWDYLHFLQHFCDTVSLSCWARLKLNYTNSSIKWSCRIINIKASPQYFWMWSLLS